MGLVLNFVIGLNPVVAFDYLQKLPKQALVPNKNLQTSEKIELGKRLFYEPLLSKEKTHSCNDCHNLLSGGDDDQAYSIGANGTRSIRNTPGLWNIGLQTVLYWDGRSKTLEKQALDHIKDPAIMGMDDLNLLVKHLAQSPQYPALFKRAFHSNNAITAKNVAKALASFQRALLAPNSPFDRYLNGERHALSKAAIKGMEEFSNMGCLACHFGVTFSGPAPGPAMKMGDGFYELFPNYLGSQYDELLGITDDLGRYNVTNKANHKYMWRVPPLRNIALTAPYFHNGSAKTLREAVKVMGKVQFDYDLNEEQITNIVAFLNSLTGELPSILRQR